MKTLFVFSFLLISLLNFAQCPITFTSNSVQAASCPSGGSIAVTASGTGVTYRLTDGPSGYSTATNTSGNFSSLTAGNYTVEASNGVCNVSINLIVANTYPTFSVAALSSPNLCTSGITGGTINATVVGGKTPYNYDIVPANGTPVYGPNTTSTNYSETVSNFGVYRLYVRDACGEVRTYEIDLQPTQPIPVEFWWEELITDRPCTETLDGLPTITLNMHLLDVNGTGINFYDLVGSTYQIYKPNPANSILWSSSNSYCTVTQGALISSGTIIAGNIPVGDNSDYPITIPQEDVIIVLTTLCGETFKYCYNFNEGNPLTPIAIFDVIQQRCNAVWLNQTVNIKLRNVHNLTSPISYLLTRNGGGTITNSTGTFNGLIMADLPATIRLTDACGTILNVNIPRPTEGSSLQAEAEPQWQFYCSNIKNTASSYIRLIGGDLQGIAEATNIVITGGTPTVVPMVSNFKNWLPGYVASNLLAGYSYKILITNLCNEKDSIIFTVPLDHWGQPTLDWNLTANTNPLCGQNKGTITAVSNYTANGAVQYYLYNQSSPNTVIATNTSGLFLDVPSGNYKVKFIVDNSASACPTNFITDSINVTLLGSGVNQTIVRKTVTFCEAGDGSQLTTGKAIVEVDGAAPFTYEIIKSNLVGTGATEVWNVSATNYSSNTYTWNLPLAGDPVNTQYTLRSTDKCGNKITTQASLQPLNAPTLQSGLQPCIGTLNYTFGVNIYGGDFTYRWVKLPDLVTTISTDPNITFPGAYTSAYNGNYKCYISLGGCVNRELDVLISSNLCLNVLPVKIKQFQGSIQKDYAQLQWKVENEQTITRYELERSLDGTNFIKIATIAKENNVNLTTGYLYKDFIENINSNVFYYKLKIMESNGNSYNSNIIKLSLQNKSSINVFPNPVKDILTVNTNLVNPSNAMLNIIDHSGKNVYKSNIKLSAGNNVMAINEISNLSSGIYILELSINGKEIRRTKFVKE